MTQIPELKNEATAFLLKKFGFAPEKSTLYLYSFKDWYRYCYEQEMIARSDGGYHPSDLSAHILNHPKYAPIFMFHEYFGHGTYFEHTKIGEHIRLLEKKREREETEEMKSKIIINPKDTPTSKELKEAYKNTFNQSEGYAMWMEWYLYKNTFNQSEGYAMWMEWYLSHEFNIQNLFNKSLTALSEDYTKPLKDFISYQTDYGEYSLVYDCGLPKHYNTRILEDLLRKHYKSKFNTIELALLFGSRNPKSDIDLFLVSNEIGSYNNSWIDVCSIKRWHLDALLRRLDISVTDPLFTGEFICGNRGYHEQMKKQVLDALITEEAIRHHQEHAEEARLLALKCDVSPQNKRTASGYSKSYSTNAKELSQGRKALTLKELRQRCPEEFTY